MNLDEFINAVFVRFPPKNISEYHTIEDCFGEYRIALTNDEEYEYDKALTDLIANYDDKYGKTPSPIELKGYLKNRIIRKPRRYVRFPSIWGDKCGQSYEFGIEYSKEQSVRELIAMGFTNIRDER